MLYRDKFNIKYDRLASSFDRIKKMLDFENKVIEGVDKQLHEFTVRRQEREKLGGKTKDALTEYINLNQ